MALSQHIAAVAFNERERIAQATAAQAATAGVGAASRGEDESSPALTIKPKGKAQASARKGARGVGRKQGRGVPLFTSNRVRLGRDGSASAQRQARSRREDRGGGK